MAILIRNTADHYNFPRTKKKKKQIKKMKEYTLIPRLETRSDVKKTATSCKVHNVSSNFNLREMCKLLLIWSIKLPYARWVQCHITWPLKHKGLLTVLRLALLRGSSWDFLFGWINFPLLLGCWCGLFDRWDCLIGCWMFICSHVWRFCFYSFGEG